MNTEIDSKIATYHILREAGRGAMSTVYEALNEQNGQIVALKVLLAPASLSLAQQHSLIARLQREARLIARLSHPNIVRILDVGEDAGRHYLAMEYLHGTTLRERLDTGPVTLTEASIILDQIAAALDTIHPQQIVHRDIKPSNVMLLPDGQVKLMDFGVARQGDDTTITQTGMIVGSPAYMSPEQIRGESGSPASDIWALGILLYEMLAGKSPFPGANIPAVLYRVSHDSPAPISGLPIAVQQVLKRALEKKPSRRYRKAREFADALRATLVHLPTLRSPLERRAARALPRGVVPLGGLLAVIVGTLLLAHVSGYPHPAMTPHLMLIGHSDPKALPASVAPNAPTVPITIKEDRPHLKAAAQKHLSHTKTLAAILPKAFKARHRATHAQRAWENHLARLAHRTKRRASRRHPSSADSHRTMRPRRQFFVSPRTSPDYQKSMPAHPVYNPGSPA